MTSLASRDGGGDDSCSWLVCGSRFMEREMIGPPDLLTLGHVTNYKKNIYREIHHRTF